MCDFLQGCLAYLNCRIVLLEPEKAYNTSIVLSLNFICVFMPFLHRESNNIHV